MPDNPFLRSHEFYTRKINPLMQYVEQNGFYLHKMTGAAPEVCKAFIANGIKNKTFADMVDPVVRFFERGDNGDTYKTVAPLSRYIMEAVKRKYVLAPTFTAYLPQSEKKSLLVDFIEGNAKRRSKSKKASAVAKAAGNIPLAISLNNDQANMKTYNNSMSGAFAAGGSLLKNPTAHSTLTTITRSVSSFGNASNEKVISGNRHYSSPDTTLFNLIAIASAVNKPALLALIYKYQLKIPTIEDVEACVHWSSDLYWSDSRAFGRLHDFIIKLDDAERAAIVYIGDLFHIRKHNPEFIRSLITELSAKITGVEVPDAAAKLNAIDESVVNYAHQICKTEVTGIGKDYSRISKEAVNTVAATAMHIIKVVDKYRDLINAILLTDVIPAATAYIPNMVRRTVVLSDTDSTMFSEDEWVLWFFGELLYTDEAFAVAGAVTYLATSCIAHNLAILSANLGVADDMLFKLQMKAEIVMPVFCQTSVSKHYWGPVCMREGNVYSDPLADMEIKGVHLKNSASPKALVKSAKERMKFIVSEIMNGRKLSLIDELKRVANIEREITASLLRGDGEYFKQSKIKAPDAYALGPEQSPYQRHTLWEDVFAPKYGTIAPPPYQVIKINTTAQNISTLSAWLGAMEDREFAERLGSWLKARKKVCLPTMYVSLDYVKAFGIPKEIVQAMNIKKLVLDLTITERMILETMGYYPKADMLISELGY